MYCFIMMKTAVHTHDSQNYRMNTLTSYKMKVLQADTEEQLLKRFIDQAEVWLRSHPQRDELNITDFTIDYEILRYPKLVQFERSAKWELPDVLSYEYKIGTENGIQCIISAYNCWEYDFGSFIFELMGAHIIPHTPMCFDSAAVESAEARDMLCGENMDSRSIWNRTGWLIGRIVSPDQLEEFNKELDQIASNPRIGSYSLKYFKGEH